ncbi:hypothetical protein KVV02_000907 [Mortierella alpina]|uniref:magnesium chelatase n=1 Tax=Mortierella alpina TaxID=64518 RepID=A0A9P8D2B2_MORAP|nr:hypothetical protein KVV02_000907 [Mortierella alpina]
MAPANRAWIRTKMAGLRKASGIAFSEEIFLSILICLIAKNKHLVLHTVPEAVPELKTIVEQHCSIVFGLTTATIVCHEHQTRSDIIGAITGRHADMLSSSTPSSQYQFPVHQYSNHTQQQHQHQHHHSQQLQPSNSTGAGQYYQYSNPTDDYIQRSSRLRFEKSRRSIATNYSEHSDYSFRPSEHHNAAPSIASFRTASERDADAASIQQQQQQSRGYHVQDTSEYSRAGGDDSSLSLRRSESRSKSTGDAMADHILHHRSRRSAHMSPAPSQQQQQQQDPASIENISLPPNSTGTSSSNTRRTPVTYLQTSSHLGGGASSSNNNNNSSSTGHAPVTPVDFTFPRRRHESVTNNTAGYSGVGGETSGITYSGRRIAQAIILDGLENASQEVYATLMEMIINKEINDRNRYVLPDLVIIALFNSPTVPDNIPKQLLDYFAINGTYHFSTPQPRIQPVLARKHALFRRTDWDELSKRMKAVTVSNDMTRYIRDVIVAVRTHEAVHGGLTARAALDLEAIMKTLAAIFQATFVTPDLLTIAAEKVFSHRLQLKSSRRQKIAASCSSSAAGSSPRQGKSAVQNGKAPMREYQQQQQHRDQTLADRKRKDSTGSDQSSEGGASFVEIPDSEDEGSADDAGVDYRRQQQEQGHIHHQDNFAELEDDRTAADVVRSVLKAVFPPV